MLNLELIGKKISLLRKQHNINQNELAEALYVTHQAVSKWENGKSIPSIEILYELTKMFNISIDYLLQDSEIPEDDYETLLRAFPRAAVINKALDKECLSIELEKIFYLLSIDERFSIINQILKKKLLVDVDLIWHLFSFKEKEYILVNSISKKLSINLDKLYSKLSIPEQRIIDSHIKDGTLDYVLPCKKGVIL